MSGRQRRNGTKGSHAIPEPLRIVDELIAEYSAGLTQPLPPSRSDQDLRAIDRAKSLGLVASRAPLATPTWERSLSRREVEPQALAVVSRPTTQAINEALSGTCTDPASNWVYLVWGRPSRQGRGFLVGRYVRPGHRVGLRTLVPIPFATEYPRDKRFDGYRFELFGQQIRSEEDARHCPPDAIWSMRSPIHTSSSEKATIALAVYRARVFHPDTPIHGRAEWRPGRTEVTYTTPTNNLNDDDTVAKIGLKLYRGVLTSNKGGQPAHYDRANEPQFFGALADTVHAVVRDGDRVNNSTLAEHGLANWRTIKKYVEGFKYDLGALEAEAIRCSRGRGLSICRVRADRPGEFKQKGA